MKSIIIVVLVAFFLPLHSLAAVETASARIEGTQISTMGGPHLTVFDNKYHTMTLNSSWNTIFTNYRITNKIRLGINPEVLQTNNLSGGVTLSIKYWKWDITTSTFIITTESKTLSIDYNTLNTNIINDLSTYVTSDALRIEVSITSINGAGFDVDDAYLEVEIETERYYTFSGSAPTGQTIVANGNNVNFEWTPVAGAEYYELEWVHVNNYRADSNASPFSTSDLSFDFYRNSTRLILTTPYYSIPKLFDKGYIVFRVRAVGLFGATFTQRKEGTWNVAENGLISSLTATNNYLQLTSEYDTDMNWGHQVMYAEDGKRFEGVSYADGIGMVRQSIGSNPVTQQTIVSNVYYDGYGRPAVSDLPTPENTTSLAHRLNFNIANGGTFYGPEHFDQVLIEDSPSCSFETTSFSLTAGAGKYYSPSNTDKTEENKRIPDAEGYPFARVEYMDDHSGRIRRAGGVGPDFQVGSGHETEFFYGTPTQQELDRLFGSEVGYAPHYQRRITVDANNQAYVEYFDMAGRVVASGLAGTAPDNLDVLSSNTPFNLTQTITEGLNGEVTPTSMILSYPLTIFSDQQYSFSYDLNPTQFKDVTCAPELCLDCMYKLDIEITEFDCGTPFFATSKRINGLEYDAICNGTYPYGWDTTIFIPENNYTLTKTLTIDQDAINGYWCTYLESNTCISTFEELFNTAYDNANFGNCDEEDVYEEEEEYSCQTMKTVMLNDMTPGGQYAGYTISGSTYTASNTISVLNTSTVLTGNWKNPTGDYLDELGNIQLIEVEYLGSGNYSPAIDGTPTTLSSTALPNGNFTIHPEDLLNLSDFVLKFEDTWAEALLPYHPEYCYLTYCLANEASHTYDAEISAITTFDGACLGGYFAPLGFIDVSSINTYVVGQFSACSTSVATDPFFKPSTNPNYSLMNTQLTDYHGTGFSMWEYAIVQTLCPDAIDQWQCYRDIKSFDCYRDQIWLTFRDLYLAEKAAIYAEAEADYIASQGCSTTVELIGNTAPFADAIPRWGFWDDLTTEYGSGVGQTDPFVEVGNQQEAACDVVCAAYADEWLAKLAQCDNLPADPANLRIDLIALCNAGCTSEHPSGATTLPPTVSITLHNGSSTVLPGGSSINDVLAGHISGFSETDLCSELLISDPGPYQEDLIAEHYMDACGCELLLQTNVAYEDLKANSQLPAGVTTVEEYLAYTTGISMEDINALICACDELAGDWNPTEYEWSPSAQETILGWQEVVDPALTCDACVECTDVQSGIDDLVTRFGSTVTESPNYELLLTNFLNEQFNFDLTYAHYNEFLLQCDGENNPYCKATDELLAWRDAMNLLAHRGHLTMGTSGAPLNLITANIVYKEGALNEYLQAEGYYVGISGNTLTQTFVKNDNAISCSTNLQLPVDATYTFDDIVAFGQIAPDNTGCDPVANTFTVEIKYIDCGELVTDIISGSTDCFPIQNCYCGGPVTLCNESIGDQFEDHTPCYEPILSQLYQEVEEQYAAEISDAKLAFRESYNAKCDDAFETELYQYTGPFNQYHYTLFYYDQAGNLVKTVAPKGVAPLSSTATTETSRNATTSIDDQDPAVLPGHSFKTEYVYNSYDQLIQTTNPDQYGETKFWYDRYGRMVASQNPEQLNANRISYVLYDKQGRPVEVGQAKGPMTSETVLKSDDLGASFKSWVYANTRLEVTFTYYDKAMSTTVSDKFAAGLQQNLRLRVASVAYFDARTGPGTPVTGYVSATHYSYDIHGNVIEVLQDVPQLAPVEQDIKSTQYTFELLSGNVKKVEYQKGRRLNPTTYVEDQRDRMTHEYVYDKLNRLTEVFTSTDKGVHKSREAHYRYFDYGPLARVEIGQHKVQGNDYAYTIHGWLKSMNSSTLNRTRDAGLDGGVDDHPTYPSPNPEMTTWVARDVTGYVMGYYDGDYQSIGTNNFIAQITTGNLHTAIRSLYNGNIAYTTNAYARTAGDGFMEQASVYKYDQLQRLKEMKVYRSTTTLTQNNNWDDAAYVDDYYNSYTYDDNGNLQELVRNGVPGVGMGISMDNFTYNYTSGTNRLHQVTDAVTATSTPGYTQDINDGQLANNYVYDDLGQLITDNTPSEVQNYTWRLGDKKLKLQKNSSKQLEFVYNPMGQRVLKIQKPVSGGNVVPQGPSVNWLYTYYTYDANGQLMATYDVVDNAGAELQWALVDEQLIYGSGRIGVIKSGKSMFSTDDPPAAETSTWQHQLGKKNYELTNHLGNVNAVITDRKVVSSGYIAATFSNSFDTWSQCTQAIRTTGAQAMRVDFYGPSNCVFKAITTVTGQNYLVRVKSLKGNTAGLRIKAFGSSLISSVNLAEDDFTTYSFTANSTSTTLIIEPTTASGSYYFVDEVNVVTNSIYEATVVMKSDYYPFGMQMPGRTATPDNYRFGYNGMEKDPEMKGDGNSYDYGARMYDPRLGRWFTQDPLKAMYPSMSPYCYALNTPIVAKDADGRYTIFVNGYIYGKQPGPIDDIKPLKPYWTEKGDQFTKAAHKYLGDGIGKYVNGTGVDALSTASQRQLTGRELGKVMAAEIKAEIYKLNHDGNPNNQVTEINFVTHSMGAATAEGMIEEFMKDPELAALMRNGEIVHFSACDGDAIDISENSKDLTRTQVNYLGDETLLGADPGATITGGYQIEGVDRFVVVKSDYEKMHPWNYKNGDPWDFHYDSKTYKDTWGYLKKYDELLKKFPSLLGEPTYMKYEDIHPVDSEIKKGGTSEEPGQNKG
jgi:RHS repeat-associated protein